VIFRGKSQEFQAVLPMFSQGSSNR